MMLANGFLLANVNESSGQIWLLLPGASKWQAVPSSILPSDIYSV
jgi:hypothetical protein